MSNKTGFPRYEKVILTIQSFIISNIWLSIAVQESVTMNMTFSAKLHIIVCVPMSIVCTNHDLKYLVGCGL